MRNVRHKPDLSKWSLPLSDEITSTLEKAISNTVESVLELAFDEGDTYITFPIEWVSDSRNSDGHGGPAVTDPLTVYLVVDIGSDDNEKPIYEFNLRDVLAGSISDCASDGSFSNGLSKLSASFKALAEEIDAAIASSTE